MSAPTEAAGLVPNFGRRPGERYDIRPHGTEAPAPAASAATASSRAPCACLRRTAPTSTGLPGGGGRDERPEPDRQRGGQDHPGLA
jgi:hypothetical protein